jgi:hypothetical protein
MQTATNKTLPQSMTQVQFIAQATATKLFNHGRDWEVFIHGQSLGFADGTKDQALVQAHGREVNNALYAHDGDAPDFYQAELPSEAALASYPELVVKFPNAIAKMRSQTCEETMLVNHYCHEDCGVQPDVEWTSTWSCACNDRCPACNKEIEPHDSVEVS